MDPNGYDWGDGWSMASFCFGIPQVMLTLCGIGIAVCNYFNHTTANDKAEARMERLEKTLKTLADEREDYENERFALQQEIDEQRHSEILDALYNGKQHERPPAKTGAERMQKMRAKRAEQDEKKVSADTMPEGFVVNQARSSGSNGASSRESSTSYNP